MDLPISLFLLISVLTYVITERILHAMCMLLVHVVYATDSDIKTTAALNILGAILIGAWDVGLEGVALLGNVLRGLVTSMLWLVLFTAVALVLTAIYEFFPETSENSLIAWNYSVGPVLHIIVMVFSRVIRLALFVIIPLFNCVSWVAVKLLTIVILPFVEIEWVHVVKVFDSFYLLLVHLFQSLRGYLLTFTACQPVANVVDVACFEPGLRMIDLVTPMLDIRNMLAYAVLIVRTNCQIMAAPFDIALFPLFDINTAKAVHNIVNVPLYLTMQLPIVTAERCKYSFSNMTDASADPVLSKLMCVPDIEPMFRMLASGFRHFGRMLDNWQDVLVVMIQQLITDKAVECDRPPFTVDTDELSSRGPAAALLFGQNKTIFVGLTSVTYAHTDGWAAQYTTYYKTPERLLIPRAWPIPIDVNYGVAAVRYSAVSKHDDAGRDTTAMLGCACYDIADSSAPTGTRMEITCAITPFEPEAFETTEVHIDEYLVPVQFSVADANKYMECRRTRISVQSVRFPVSRVARPDQSLLRNVRDPVLEYGDAGFGDDGPVELDAVVYVMPRCRFGADFNPDTQGDMYDALDEANAGTNDAACIDSFKSAGCFPYCFASRPTRSANSVLTLYDVDVWETSVQLLNRDCGLGTVTVPEDLRDMLKTDLRYEAGGVSTKKLSFSATQGIDTGTYMTIQFLATQVDNAQVVASKANAGDMSDRQACLYNRNVVSRVNRASLSAYGDKDDALVAGAWASDSVRLEAQPFAFAGDAQLLVEWDGDDAYIRTRRLYSAERGHVTLMTLPQRLLTSGTCKLLSSCPETAFDPSRLTVPRAYSASATDSGPSVSTRWSALYAVNPSPDIYAQFFRYCREVGNVKTQFQKDTSYAEPRVYRVDVFTQAASAPPSGVPSFVQFDGFSRRTEWSECSRPVNMSIEALSYLNDYNVAITVLRASPQWFDLKKRQAIPNAPLNASAVYYDVYYLNPLTMAIRHDQMWDPDAASTVLAQGELCPAMRRTPQLGSALAEGMVAITYVVRWFVSILVYVPSVTFQGAKAWSRLYDCPTVTRGHTILRECGRDIFSLDKAFDAHFKLQTHLWRSLAIAASYLEGFTEAHQLRMFMNGFAVLGTNAITLQQITVLEQTERLITSAVSRMPSPMRNGMQFVIAGTNIARFTLDTVEELIVRSLMESAAQDKTSAADLVLAIGNRLWNTLYDRMAAWRQMVLLPATEACAGLGIMLGYSNPVAALVRQICMYNIEAMNAALNMVTVTMVDYPTMQCLCGMRSGAVFEEEAMYNCFRAAPLEYHPVILQAVQYALQNGGDTEGFFETMCIAMVTAANDRLYHAPDVMFSLMYDIADSTRPLMQYLMSSISADDSAVCSNFYTSPFVMALMPYPLDYFRVCGETPTCKLRCENEVSAFEAARGGVLRRFGGSQDKLSILVEQPFFTESEISAGRVAVAPFRILGMIEFDNCEEACGPAETLGIRWGQKSARCFAIAGIDSTEQVATQAYCIPASANTGVRKVGEPRVVAGSQLWSTRVVDIKFLGSRERPDYYQYTATTPILLIIRDDGLFVASPLGILKQLVRILDMQETYSELRNSRIHRISSATPIQQTYSTSPPTLTSKTRIIVQGATEVTLVNDVVKTLEQCAVFTVDLGKLGASDSSVQWTDTTCVASSTLSSITLSTYALVTTFPYMLIALVPLQNGLPMGICEGGLDEATLELLDCTYTDPSQSNLATSADIVGAAANIEYMFTQSGQITRTTSVVAQTCSTLVDLSKLNVDADTVNLTLPEASQSKNFRRVFTALGSMHTSTRTGWLSDIRIEVPSVADGGIEGGDVKMQRSTSTPRMLDATIERECSVMSCAGCADRTTQQLCYSAQQCAIARCVGTTVNMNQPLCGIGGVLAELMAAGTTTWVALWISVYEVTALVVNAATGTLSDRIEIQFPYDAANMAICEIKDIIVTVYSVMTSFINRLTITQMSMTLEDSVSAQTDATASSTLVLSSLTNLLSHITYIPIYSLAVQMQITVCNINQMVTLFDLTGTQIRIGTLSQMEALGQVGGQCAAVLTGEAAADASAGNTLNQFSAAAYSAYKRDQTYQRYAAAQTSSADDLAQQTPEQRSASLMERARNNMKKTYGYIKGGSWVPTRGRVWNGILSMRMRADLVRPATVGSTVKQLQQQVSRIYRMRGLSGKAGKAIMHGALGAPSFFKRSMSAAFIDPKKEAKIAQRKELLKNNPNAKKPGLLSKLTPERFKFNRNFWADGTAHILDAAITYFIGIVRTLEDLITTTDTTRCRMPDITASDAPKCACGDTPARIPADRSKQTLLDSAFWCTGFLQLANVDGSANIIYNPYSLDELRAIVKPKMARYLECIASGGQSEDNVACSELEPRAPKLYEQGVSTLQVLTRCRSNYANKQWDMAAALLFADAFKPVLQFYHIGINAYPHATVRNCMAQAVTENASPDRCLQLFLTLTAQTMSEYFAYETLETTDVDAVYDNVLADACQVFTGPAKLNREPFTTCANMSNRDGRCSLEYIVWSGRSTNKVPVATEHMDITTQQGTASRLKIAYEEMQSARRSVIAELDKFLSSGWEEHGDGIKVSLFTSEGDMIHQAFDCMILGPYGIADMWPTEAGLAAPRYSRRPDSEVNAYITELTRAATSSTNTTQYAYEYMGNAYSMYDDIYGDGTYSPPSDDGIPAFANTLSREFELPCTGARLQGDNVSPFTCGSSSRRAIIKHFIRDVLGSTDANDAGGASNASTSFVIQETVKSFRLMRERWQNDANFGCACKGDGSEMRQVTRATELSALASMQPGEHGLECCSEDDIAAWSGWRQRVMGHEIVSGERLADRLMDEIARYTVNQLVTDTFTATNKYAPAGTDYTWSEAQMLLAADLGLLDATEPIKTYGPDETLAPKTKRARQSKGGQVVEASLWDMCTGLVQTTMFTMPVSTSANDPDPEQWRPHVVRSSPAFAMAGDNSGEYASSIENFVQGVLLNDARLKSPMYWQYAMRHVPSESMVCLGKISADLKDAGNRDSRTTVGLDTSKLPSSLKDTIVNEITMNDPVESPPVQPVLAYLGAFARRLGGVSETCACGWQSASKCTIPAAVCRFAWDTLTGGSGGAYTSVLIEDGLCPPRESGTDGEYSPQRHFWAVTATVEAFFADENNADAVACDSMRPSDAWGVLQRAQSVAWVTAQYEADHRRTQWAISMHSLLSEGRSGLRITSLMDTLRHWQQFVNPRARARAIVDTSRANATAAQRLCTHNIRAAMLTDLTNRYVDELFPMVQGVSSAVPAVDACTRFGIEVARLSFLHSAQEALRNISETDIDTVTAEQAANVQQWRQKCGTQINMLSMCSVRGIYDHTPPPTAVTPRNASWLQHCPFGVSETASTKFPERTYVTPGCVLYIGDAFYDLCQCGRCTGTSTSLAVVLEQCQASIDVREFVSQPVRGGSMHWATQWAPQKNPQVDELLFAIETLLRNAPAPTALHRQNLFEQMLDPAANWKKGLYNGGDSKIVHWSRQEGLASEGSLYCDMVSDWWPDDWTEPAGFHVTTPPHDADTGYRVFDNSFYVHRKQNVQTTIFYEHDFLRNHSLLHDYLGAGGVCNIDTYGLEMPETNNVRSCVAMSRHREADPMVPLRSSPGAGGSGDFFAEQCSEDSHDTLWDLVSDDAKTMLTPNPLRQVLSSGLIPLWYDPDNSFWPPRGKTSIYPRDTLPIMGSTRFLTPEDAFGGQDACFHPALTSCSTDSDCANLALQDSAAPLLRCRRGVCTLLRQPGFDRPLDWLHDCIQHDDCSSEEQADKMCSGWGRCTQPILEVTNERDTEIEAQLYAAGCASKSELLHAEDMYGASPWEHVEDILPASGLCSFRRWYEQQDLTFAQARGEQCLNIQSSDPLTADTCSVDSKTTRRVHTDTQGEAYRGTLWDEKLLRMQSTVCDKSFMHMENMPACRPASETYVFERSAAANSTEQPQQMSADELTFGTVLRTHSRTGRSGTMTQPYESQDRQALGKLQLAMFKDFAGLGAPYGFINQGFNVSYDRLLDPTRNDPDRPNYLGKRDSLFRMCSEIEQCTLQPVTMNGFAVTERMAITPEDIAKILQASSAYSATINTRPVSFRDVFTCGAMGLYTRDSVTGLPSPSGECVLDPVTSRLFYAMCRGSQAQMQRIRDTCSPILLSSSTSYYQNSICSITDSRGSRIQLPYYAASQRSTVASHINWMQNDMLASPVNTFNDYLNRVDCAIAIWNAISDSALSKAPRVLVRADPADLEYTHTIPLGMYHIQETFAIAEFPFAWWFKCTLLTGIKPQAGVSVECPAWTDRTDAMSRVSGTIMQALRQFNGVITRNRYLLAVQNPNYRYKTVCKYVVDPDLPLQPGDNALTEAERHLAYLFQVAREYLLQHEGLQLLKQQCKTARNYNLQFISSEDFVDWASRVCDDPDRLDILNEPYVTSNDAYEAFDASTHILLRTGVQEKLCGFWFGADDNEITRSPTWLDVSDVDMLEVIPTQAGFTGVPVARFTRLDYVSDRSTMDKILAKQSETLFTVNECTRTIMTKNQKTPDNSFCVYEGFVDMDPVKKAYPTDGNEKTAYVMTVKNGGTLDYTYAEAVRLFQTHMVINRFYVLQDVCNGPKKNSIATTQKAVAQVGLQDSTSIRKIYREFFEDKNPLRDVMGQSCKLFVESEADICRPAYAKTYSDAIIAANPNKFTGVFLQCRPGYAFEWQLATSQKAITTEQNAIVKQYLAQPPVATAGACYDADSVCYNGMIRIMDSIHIPPGIRAAIYRQRPGKFPNPSYVYEKGVSAQTESSPVEVWNTMPAWYNCPTPDVPKSTHRYPTQSANPSTYVYSQPIWDDLNPTIIENELRSGTFASYMTDRVTNGNIRAMRLMFQDETFCCHDSAYTCSLRCKYFRGIVEVARNLWQCVQCTRCPKTYCTGRFDCIFRAMPQESVEGTQQVRLNQAGLAVEPDKIFEPSDILPILHVMARTYLTQMRDRPLDDRMRIMPTSEDAPFFTDVPNLDNFAGFSGAAAALYMRSLSAGGGKDISECANADVDSTLVNYGVCQHHAHLQRLKQFADNNYRRRAFLTVRPARTAAFPTSRFMHTRPMIFAAADRARKLRDRFAAYALEHDVHCSQGAIYSSICMEDSLNRPVLFSPWTGGDFNPFDLCDTAYGDSNARSIRTVDARCNREACPNLYKPGQQLQKDAFLQNIPPHCTLRNMQPPNTQSIQDTVPTNICFLQPRRNATCEHYTATLGGSVGAGGFVTDGKSVQDLYYEFSLPQSTPTGGLFYVPDGDPESDLPAFKNPRRNRLLAGELKAEAGYKQAEDMSFALSPQDIAGHHLRIVVPARGAPRMMAVVLGEPSDPPLVPELAARQAMSVPSADVRDWMQDIETRFIIESSRIARHVPPDAPAQDTLRGADVAIPWDCALRRLTFWSNLPYVAPSFRPVIPEPRRTKAMFGRLNAMTFTHPLVPDADKQSLDETSTNNKAIFRTTDGVCVCARSVDCSTRTSVNGPCSLYNAISTLVTRQPQTARSVGAACLDQVDWPYANAKLRDETSLPGLRHARACSLLERLPAFRVRAGQQQRSLARSRSAHTKRFGRVLTTLDDGGDCHTGRAASVGSRDASHLYTLISRRCMLTEKSALHVRIRCDGKHRNGDATQTDLDEPDEEIVLPRERSTPLMASIHAARSARKTCKTDRTRPSFKVLSRPASANAAFPTTQLPAAPSSFGEPWRVSSERLISADLLRQLCRALAAAAQNLLFCSDKHIQAMQADHDGALRLNGARWTVGNFLHTLLHEPHKLLVSQAGGKGTNTSAKNIFADASSEDLFGDIDGMERELFAQQWVSCDRDADNGTITRCFGNMTAEQWAQHPTRYAQCKEGINIAQRDKGISLVSDLPICDLSGTTDRLCAHIAEAENQLLEANCLAAGLCSRSAFFYSPAMYSMTNGEFVRETVQSFYRGIDADSCPEFDERLILLMEQNNELRWKCSASYLELLERQLQNIRPVLQDIVRISSYLFMIIINLFTLLLPGIDYQVVLDQIKGYLMELLETFVLMIYGFGDSVMNMLFETPIGKGLKKTIEAICRFIAWIKLNFTQPLSCTIMPGVIDALAWVQNAFESVKNWEFLGGKPFEWISVPDFSDIVAQKPAMVASCHKKDDLNCDLFSDTLEPESAAFNNPTRCWARYMTFLGDENDLSCTAADTCAPAFGDEDTSGTHRTTNVVCDACPVAPAGVDDFGCDPIRKVCACSVPRRDRTPCLNHRQCRDEQDSTCAFVDDDVTQTFSTTPCKLCATEPMCMLSPGGAAAGAGETGYCACMLRRKPTASCSEDNVGSRVLAATGDLCLTALGSAATQLQASSAYAAEYDRLAAMPCYMAAIESVFCFRVQLGPYSYVTRVVVLDHLMLSGASPNSVVRRRLLAADGSDANATSSTAGWVHLEWHDASGLCEELARLWHMGDGSTKHLASVSDRLALQQCIFWRDAAASIISKYNLTHVSDHFLLSWYDLALELADFDTLAEFVAKPIALFDALSYAPIFAPLRSIATLAFRWVQAHQQVAMAVRDELLATQNITAEQAQAAVPHVFESFTMFVQAVARGDINWGTAENATAAVVDTIAARLVRDASIRQLQQDLVAQLRVYTHGHAHNASASLGSMLFAESMAIFAASRAPKPTNASHRDATNATAAAGPSAPLHHRRALLQADATWKARLTSDKIYNLQEQLNGGIGRAAVPGALGDAWVTGPVTWPPDYSYFTRSKASQCHVGEVTYTMVVSTITTLVQLWTKTGPAEPRAESNFIKAAPHIPQKYRNTSATLSPKARFNSTRADTGLWLLYKLRDVVEGVSSDLSPVRVFNVMASIPTVLKDMFTCSLDDVMFCAKRKRTLWVSFWWALIIYLMLYLLLSIFGLGYLIFVLAFLFPVLVLHLATGYALTCIPMIPVCVTDEFFDTLEWLFPMRLYWPSSLQTSPDCITQKLKGEVPITTRCFMSCSEDPHIFTRWEAPTAWWICDIDTASCRRFSAWLDANANGWFVVLQKYIDQKATLLETFGGTSDIAVAQRICATITSWYFMPWVLILLVASYGIVYITLIPIIIVRVIIRVLWQVFVMVHTQVRTRANNIFMRHALRTAEQVL